MHMALSRRSSVLFIATILQLTGSFQGDSETVSRPTEFSYIGSVPALVWADTPGQLDFMQSVLVLIDQYEDPQKLTDGPWVSSLFISAHDSIINYHFNVSYMSALDEFQKEIVGKSRSDSNECFVQQYLNEKDESFYIGATAATRENSELAKRCFVLMLGLSSGKLSPADADLNSVEILSKLLN